VKTAVSQSFLKKKKGGKFFFFFPPKAAPQLWPCRPTCRPRDTGEPEGPAHHTETRFSHSRPSIQPSIASAREGKTLQPFPSTARDSLATKSGLSRPDLRSAPIHCFGSVRPLRPRPQALSWLVSSSAQPSGSASEPGLAVCCRPSETPQQPVAWASAKAGCELGGRSRASCTTGLPSPHGLCLSSGAVSRAADWEKKRLQSNRWNFLPPAGVELQACRAAGSVPQAAHPPAWPASFRPTCPAWENSIDQPPP